MGLAEGTPGAFSSTTQGFVWSKTLTSGLELLSIPFGIGQLKASNVVVSATLGVQLATDLDMDAELDADASAQIDLMVTFLGAETATPLLIEFDPEVALLAEKVLGPDGRVISYANPGKPLAIPLQAFGIEFSFQLGAGGPRSSVTIYEALNGLAQLASGVIEHPLDQVIVFPALLDLGLYVDRLVLDLSDIAAGSLSGLMPEVYNPSWKGVGARQITLLFPIAGTDECVAAGVQGFLLGFDGCVSGDFAISYTNLRPGALVREASGQLQLRNNEFLESAISLGLDLCSASKRAGAAALSAAATGGMSGAQRSLHERVRDQSAEPLLDASVDAMLHCKLGVISHTLEGRKIVGVELVASGLTIDGVSSDLVTLYGLAARSIFWLGGGGLAGYLLGEGLARNSSAELVGGTGLLMLLLCDMMSVISARPLLPQLDELGLSQLGYRFVRTRRPGEEPCDLHQLMLGLRAHFRLDGVLLDLLNGLADVLGSALLSTADVFGESISAIRITGGVTLEFQGITLSFGATGEADEQMRRLLGQQDMAIKARELPVFIFEQDGAAAGRDTPLLNAQLVSRTRSDGQEEYGVSLLLTGIASPELALATPAGGIVLYFFPDLRLELTPQLAIAPKFTLLMPGSCLVEGVIDLARPLPALGGRQNRVGVAVGIAPTVSAPIDELWKLSNYAYQFSGQLAWGDWTPDEGPRDRQSFWFARIGYQGKSPLLVLGPLGLYGFDLILGKNIAPGVRGGEISAMGIAAWIEGESGDDAFVNVRTWPEVPAADGSTWHPAVRWTGDEYATRWAFGASATAGSLVDGGDTLKGTAIVLTGGDTASMDQFWLAIAGVVTMRPLSATLKVIIVYDAATFAIKASFLMRVDESGAIVELSGPLSIGTSGERFWIYLGHYQDAQGGPLRADLFKILSAKAYYDFDTNGLPDFGLVPDSAISLPSLPGPSLGFGSMVQFGPKTYGPSFLNLKLFAALGFNVGLSFNPFCVVGQLYATGYIQLKIFFFKFKLGLLAFLEGIADAERYRFRGELTVTIGLPWPFDDIKASLDFSIENSDDIPPPMPAIDVGAAALYRIESRSAELPADQQPEVPIDGVVAIAFNKPIYELIGGEPGVDRTRLFLNDDNPDNDQISEQVETDYQGERYRITYQHVIENLRVERQGANGRPYTVESLLASWETPALTRGSTPLRDQARHQRLYLNTLVPPERQFSRQELGAYLDWSRREGWISPCARPGTACIMDVRPRPQLERDGAPVLVFNTRLGAVTLRQTGVRQHSWDLPANGGELGWTEDGARLELPHGTAVEIPDMSAVDLTLALDHPIQAPPAAMLPGSFRVELMITLRGVASPIGFDLLITPDAQRSCGLHATLDGLDGDPQRFEVLLSQQCLAPGKLAASLRLVARQALHSIQRIVLVGFHTSGSAARVMLPVKDPAGLMRQPQRILAPRNVRVEYRLLLTSLCIERAGSQTSEWGVLRKSMNTQPQADPAQAESLNSFALLVPDQRYTIHYTLHTFATIYRLGSGGAKKMGEAQRSLDTASPNDQKLGPVVFRTERSPSQEVARYVGFTFPDEGMQRPYPDAIVPLMSLKYGGLIRTIYARHYGQRALLPEIRDLEGHALRPVQRASIALQSGGADRPIEELLESCAPYARGFSALELQVWEKGLEPDTHYALGLQPSAAARGAGKPFSVAFQTSRYRDIRAHVSAAEALAAHAMLEPLLPEALPGRLVAALSEVIAGEAPGGDELLERLYRELLGRDGGQLSAAAGHDALAYLLGSDPGGRQIVWGVALELAEPLLGKEGVALQLRAQQQGLRARGLHFTQEGYLLVSDRSGSRLLILRSQDGTSISPLEQGVALTIRFGMQEALGTVIQRYVEQTYVELLPADQARLASAALQEIIDVLAGQGGIAPPAEVTLSIPMPV